MSGWKKHLYIGLITQITTMVLIQTTGLLLWNQWLLGLKELLIITPLLFINPLIPDLDHSSSKITTTFLLITVLGFTTGIIKSLFFDDSKINIIILLSYALLTITIIISRFFKHRGVTHKTITNIIYSTIIGLVTMNPSIGIISFAGYQSHLIMDKTTTRNKKDESRH